MRLFIGDSILSNRPSLQPPNESSGMQVVNRGIPGETASNMLARFRRDVVHLRPRVVGILGGLNDLAQTPLSFTEQNLSVMTQTAQEHKIHVVLATVPPGHKPNRDTPVSTAAGQNQMLVLSSWLKSFAEQSHFAVAEFYSTLADEHGSFQTGLTYDGLHPTVDGYRRMELLLRQAVQNAISSTNSN